MVDVHAHDNMGDGGATLTPCHLYVKKDTILNNDGGSFDTQIKGNTDDNLLFADASADKIGIGTATPGTKLDVSGTLNVTGDATFDTNTLFVDVSANSVGVGTTSPGALLHVTGSGASTEVLIEDTLSGRAAGVNLKNTAREWSVYADSSPDIFSIHDKTGAADRLVIDNSGNVGIGTTSPGAKLDVRGSAIFNEDQGDNDFRIEGNNETHLLYVDADTGDSKNLGRVNINAQDLTTNASREAWWDDGPYGATRLYALDDTDFTAEGSQSNKYAQTAYLFEHTGDLLGEKYGEGGYECTNHAIMRVVGYGDFISNEASVFQARIMNASTNHYGNCIGAILPDDSDNDEYYFFAGWQAGLGYAEDNMGYVRVMIAGDGVGWFDGSLMSNKGGLFNINDYSEFFNYYPDMTDPRDDVDDFLVMGDSVDNLFYVDVSTDRVGIGEASPDAPLEVSTIATEGTQALTIDQNDADQAFIDFQGTQSDDANNNISCLTAAATKGFVRVEVNGVTRWIKVYDTPTS